LTNNAKKIVEEIDKVTEGFKKVPVIERPPKVKWGKEFNKWDIQKQNDYLKRFAESMNHAAGTIQKERDKLGKLAEIKENQLMQMQSMLEANNRMIQAEVAKMNEYRQQAQQHAAKLEAKIRELESGDIK
jgi:predicted  nucleic acid-binding Zn-ribbon protein